MTALVMATAGLLFPHRAEAKAAFTSFSKLVASADAIVTGTIVAVGEETFDLRVAGSLHGTLAPGETTSILQFCNWTCGRRWAPYEEGQKLALFLKTAGPNARGMCRGRLASRESGTKPGLLMPTGSVNEGEMPIVGDRILVSSFTTARLAYADPASSASATVPMTAFGHQYVGVPVSWTTFSDAVLFRDKLRSEVVEQIGKLSPDQLEQLMTVHRGFREILPALSTLADQSPLHASLIVEAIEEARRLHRERRLREIPD